jgi:SHS2 domain-containing protein
MSRPGYRHLSHTADVGLAAWGSTLAEAFAETIRGTVAVTYDLRRIRPFDERVVGATATDDARLLVDLLDDVLYLVETEGFVPARATVALSDSRAEARLFGETFDPARHRRAGPQVKAITYHGLRIAPGPPARVRLLLDI